MPAKILKPVELKHSATILTTIISFITTIVYCTWYLATEEKRISLVEQHQVEIESHISLMREDNEKTNEQQQTQQINFQNEIHSDIAQLSTRIEQIYQILLDNRKRLG